MNNKSFLTLLAVGLLGLTMTSAAEPRQTKAVTTVTESIRVGKDGRHFVFSRSGAEFNPWGFNYDHDTSGRLLEEYWQEEWDTVQADFKEMKALGANTVRVHLQVSAFMKSERELNKQSLKQLARLLALAEQSGLYLDITGLGCYKKENVPGWYNLLDEQRRWDVQARFWDAVARTCRRSPAVFCYDLMNEPVLTEDKKNRDWTPGAFGNKYFVQRLTLDLAGRTREEVAKAWVEKMVAAIRKHDRHHLITVGAIPWAHTWPNAKPLFYSREVSQSLDFVSVHFYPESGQVDKALKALAVYDIGKPLVIEEMFPLKCLVEELDRFVEESRTVADGWIGFYWGKTPAEYRRENNGAGLLMTGWLDYFAQTANRN
ncbi:MAG TPA: cellulase family glycosylhydrolase [Clostridia bacterium]|nr:cellulase family glycosylhydrolase [Clostridia bacterium]